MVTPRLKITVLVIVAFMSVLLAINMMEPKIKPATLKESLASMKYSIKDADVALTPSTFSIVGKADPLQISDEVKQRLFNSGSVSRREAFSVKLQGVLWSDKDQASSKAIINGSIASVGDTVMGVQVVRIEKNSVTVTSGGREVVLALS